MKFIVDENIPFIQGRLEPFGEVIYADQFGFTPELVKDADALLIRTRTPCGASLLEGSKVELIATATIGMDQIDLPWCAAHGIEVRNAPGCNAPGVAQYVWSSLLRLGFDPRTQTLGIVGCGNVGSVVKEWADLLGCKTLVNDPPKQEAGAKPGYDYVSLEEVMKNSDAVTLHTPLTREGSHPSFHLIGAAEIALMPKNAILVNAARGPVLNTAEAKEVLARRKDIKVAIDTWEGEPALDKELLKRAEIGTFHIAGYSHEGKQRATRMALEAVAEHFSLPIDMSGLEPAYTPKASLKPQEILDSYNPYDDDAPLRANPDGFDILRHDYNFRHETGHGQ